MRIGIDCRLSGKTHAGIGRYIEHLITQLPDYKNHSWVFFFFDQTQVTSCFPNELPENVEIQFVPIRHYTFREQFLLPWYFYQANLDLLHVPHFNIPIFYPRKMVVTIHDLLWHTQRGAHVTTLNPVTYWLKYLFYRFITRVSIVRARKVIVPSKTIKDTILAFFPFAKDKIVITKEGVDLPQITTASIISEELTKKVQKMKPFLLYVGSLYPHKNVRLVINALKELPDLQLIITGSRSVFQKDIEQAIHEADLKKRVLFTGYLTDTELSYVYSHASALVQPSFSEGFGLTGIEALSLEVPVLASDIPIFREIYKDAVLYFDPYSVDSFVAAVKTHTKKKYTDKKAVSTAITKEYNWQQMAKQTVELYNSLLTNS